MNQLTLLHMLLIAMTFIGLKNHVTILPALLEHGGRDSWLAVLLAAALMIPWLLLILTIHKQAKGVPIRDWLEGRMGKRFTTILFFYHCVLFTRTSGVYNARDAAMVKYDIFT